jgi:hypothetical protein
VIISAKSGLDFALPVTGAAVQGGFFAGNRARSAEPAASAARASPQVRPAAPVPVAAPVAGRHGGVTSAESRRGPFKSAVPSNIVSPVRRCSRTACGRPAVATLTYVYADSTAVLGPLATYAEPHCYDLCAEHSDRLTAPRGWDVVRLTDGSAPAHPSGDDLEALANAVREAARPHDVPADSDVGSARTANPASAGRRGHLRVLRSPE